MNFTENLMGLTASCFGLGALTGYLVTFVIFERKYKELLEKIANSCKQETSNVPT